MRNNKIVYSICVEDIQEVAQSELHRKLNKEELELITRKIGDYIDWYEATNEAIQDVLRQSGKDERDRFMEKNLQ